MQVYKPPDDLACADTFFRFFYLLRRKLCIVFNFYHANYLKYNYYLFNIPVTFKIMAL